MTSLPHLRPSIKRAAPSNSEPHPQPAAPIIHYRGMLKLLLHPIAACRFYCIAQPFKALPLPLPNSPLACLQNVAPKPSKSMRLPCNSFSPPIAYDSSCSPFILCRFCAIPKLPLLYVLKLYCSTACQLPFQLQQKYYKLACNMSLHKCLPKACLQLIALEAGFLETCNFYNPPIVCLQFATPMSPLHDMPLLQHACLQSSTITALFMACLFYSMPACSPQLLQPSSWHASPLLLLQHACNPPWHASP
jgi:hypothetical protein